MISFGIRDCRQSRNLLLKQISQVFRDLFEGKADSRIFQEKYKAALKTRKDVEIQDYSTMQHGWMGARGFYNGEESVKGFEKGYRDSFISGLVEALTNL